MSKKKNKIKYGLENAHYAEIIEGENHVLSYGKPVPIPGSVSIALSPVGDTTPFSADNIEYFTAIANNGYDGTVEFALIPDDFKENIMGEVVDSNGVAFEDSDAQPKAFALLFEFKGDEHGIRHVMYNCKATRPNIDGNTKGQSVEVKTETLNLTCRPATDTKFVKANTRNTTNDAVVNGWYDDVYLKSTTLGELAITSAAGSTTGKTTITVSPALTSGRTYRYKTGASVTLPKLNDDLSSWTEWNGTEDITATTGQKIAVAEVDAESKAQAAGLATVTAKS